MHLFQTMPSAKINTDGVADYALALLVHSLFAKDILKAVFDIYIHIILIIIIIIIIILLLLLLLLLL